LPVAGCQLPVARKIVGAHKLGGWVARQLGARAARPHRSHPQWWLWRSWGQAGEPPALPGFFCPPPKAYQRAEAL